MSADVTCSRCRKTVELAYARARWRRSGDSWDCRTHDLGLDRLRILQAVASGAQPHIPPIRLSWLRREGYVRMADGPRPPISGKRNLRDFKKLRVFLTERGEREVVEASGMSPISHEEKARTP